MDNMSALITKCEFNKSLNYNQSIFNLFNCIYGLILSKDDTITNLTNEIQANRASLDTLSQKLIENTQQREAFEKDFFTKFCLIVNSKKDEIQRLCGETNLLKEQNEALKSQLSSIERLHTLPYDSNLILDPNNFNDDDNDHNNINNESLKKGKMKKTTSRKKIRNSLSQSTSQLSQQSTSQLSQQSQVITSSSISTTTSTTTNSLKVNPKSSTTPTSSILTQNSDFGLDLSNDDFGDNDNKIKINSTQLRSQRQKRDIISQENKKSDDFNDNDFNDNDKTISQFSQSDIISSSQTRNTKSKQNKPTTTSSSSSNTTTSSIVEENISKKRRSSSPPSTIMNHNNTNFIALSQEEIIFPQDNVSNIVKPPTGKKTNNKIEKNHKPMTRVRQMFGSSSDEEDSIK